MFLLINAIVVIQFSFYHVNRKKNNLKAKIKNIEKRECNF